MKRIFSGIPVILVSLLSVGAWGQKSEPLKIGLLIQDSKSVEAMQGAELAILKANNDGGYKGRLFELVVRSMEGPWGTGSKQAVDMIFNHDVIAIIGSHDGRNAHLAEQATTKSHVTFLSAWAGDPTLSQAFTPWFFNCVPNDNQQADILIDEIRKKKYRKLTIVADNDYDATSAFKNFVRKSAEKGSLKPVTIIIDKSERDLSGTAQLIRNTDADCLLLFTEPAAAGKIIRNLREMKISLPVYGPLSLLKESSAIYSYPEVFGNLLLFSQGDWHLGERSEFASKYNEKFGSYPGATAAYAFDAMMVMIKAVKIAEADRENVQKALLVTDHKGTTGTIKFDDKGNRKSTVSVNE
jgi:branched-chain amino acid transport system substrate-binding protein